MPTRLLLDGEDLQSLMLRVRAEMGPDARIVKAERIRTGGVGGFFAREHYEITVEVPDVEHPRLGRRRSGDGGTDGSTSKGATGAPVGLDALLAAADAAEVDEPEGAEHPDAAEESLPASRVSTAGESFAAVLESVRQMVGAPPEPDEVPEGPEPVAPPGAEEPAAAAPIDPQHPADPATGATTEPAPDEPAAATPSGPVRPTPPPPGLEPERSGSSVNSLLELGIPTRLLAGFADPKAAVPLSVLVRRFDPPPSLWLAPGRVIAVVGEGNDALATARQMAHRAGTDPYDIVLAGEMDPVSGHGRRLQTPAAVARYRSRISPDVPAIMAIGVGPEREDWAAAAALIAALEPSQTWAVLDSRRKAVDLRRWLRAVGARRSFDAVAATSTFDAQAPGTVLNLGTPVGWVDGLPASPVVWAAVLSERLADDARWD